MKLFKMKTTVFVVIGCLFASAASALEVSQIVESLQSSDFSLELESRDALKDAFAAASASEGESEDREAYESAILEVLKSEDSPGDKAYLIHMLELFGSENAAEGVYPFLGDKNVAVRDSARRALAAIPGDVAAGYLLEGLSKSLDAERGAFVDLLAYRGDDAAIPEIAKFLKSEDAALASSAALALGKMNSEQAAPYLLEARKSASGAFGLDLEWALLDLGVDAELASQLAEHGSNVAVQSAAFSQLVAMDEDRADVVLGRVLKQPEFEGRSRFLRAAMESASMRVRLVKDLETMSLDDQLVVIDAVGEMELSQFEPDLLALVSSTGDERGDAIIDALSRVGSDASFEVLYEAFIKDPKNKSLMAGVARLRAPVADERAMDIVKNGSNLKARVASMKILEIRNTPGATELLNSYVKSSSEVKLKQAALGSLELIGNLESIQMLVESVLSNDAFARPSQRSLKRLSLNYGDPDYQFEEIYLPAIESAESVKAKESLIVILDGVPGDSTLEYLKEIALDSESELRSVALRTLARWPNYDSGPVWLDLASAETASAKDIELARKTLVRMLSRTEKSKAWDRVKLAVVAIQNAPDAAFKQAILDVYKEPSPAEIRMVRSRFQALKDDPDVGEQVKALLD